MSLEMYSQQYKILMTVADLNADVNLDCMELYSENYD